MVTFEALPEKMFVAEQAVGEGINLDGIGVREMGERISQRMGATKARSATDIDSVFGGVRVGDFGDRDIQHGDSLLT